MGTKHSLKECFQINEILMVIDLEKNVGSMGWVKPCGKACYEWPAIQEMTWIFGQELSLGRKEGKGFLGCQTMEEQHMKHI